MKSQVSLVKLLVLAFAVTGTGALAQGANPYQGFKLPPLEVPSEFPYTHEFVTVLGSRIAYVDEGKGDIGRGLHYVQEDQPYAIGRAISDWYRRVEANGRSTNQDAAHRTKSADFPELARNPE